MDTYSQALKNYHEGKKPDKFEIIRDDGYSSIVPISVFFDASNFSDIELLALNNCKGQILDIGAGAGRHSLELQLRNAHVTALDISPTAVDIMNTRGVSKVIHSDIMDLSNEQYDTLLMLMNGIGMVGDPENLERFLIKAKNLLTNNGVIIFDSVDVSRTNHPKHVDYRNKNISINKSSGQQKLRINYAGVSGDWFNWLHICFHELTHFAKKNGFVSELIRSEENGNYIAKLHKS